MNVVTNEKQINVLGASSTNVEPRQIIIIYILSLVTHHHVMDYVLSILFFTLVSYAKV
jgi:hypothetical protein